MLILATEKVLCDFHHRVAMTNNLEDSDNFSLLPALSSFWRIKKANVLGTVEPPPETYPQL
jgi:hypothetical protein